MEADGGLKWVLVGRGGGVLGCKGLDRRKLLAAEGQVLVGGGGPRPPQPMKMVPRSSKPIKMLLKPPH